MFNGWSQSRASLTFDLIFTALISLPPPYFAHPQTFAPFIAKKTWRSICIPHHLIYEQLPCFPHSLRQTNVTLGSTFPGAHICSQKQSNILIPIQSPLVRYIVLYWPLFIKDEEGFIDQLWTLQPLSDKLNMTVRHISHSSLHKK